MAREKFQKFRLYASIAIIGILSTITPSVSAQESSYYTPAKYEDGVVTRYEVKTVIKYYDKVTGLSVKPEEITDLETINVVEEKQLVPHYYSTVAKYNATSDENTSVKYYQWGKSAETSKLLFEVSDGENADLVADFVPQRPSIQAAQAPQQVTPEAPQIRQNVTYLTKEQIRAYEQAQREKVELAKQSLKTPKQLAKEAKAEQRLKAQQERKLLKINRQAEIESKKIKIEAKKAEIKAQKEADARYKSIAKELKQGEKARLAEEKQMEKETLKVTLKEKQELKASLKQQKEAVAKERKLLIKQEKASLKAARQAEIKQQKENAAVLKSMAKKLQDADNEKMIQQKTAEKQAKENLKAQQKLEKEQANSQKRVEKELSKIKTQTPELRESNAIEETKENVQSKYAPTDNGYKVYQEPKYIKTDKASVDLKGKRLNVNIPIQLKRHSSNSADRTIIKAMGEEFKYKNTSRTASLGVLKYSK